jgi:hypothetical protein
VSPVWVALEVDVATAPEVVWSELTAVERWPLWNPGVSFATLRGEALESGAPLLWQIDGIRMRSRITEVELPHVFAGTFQTLGAHGTFRWTLSEGNATRVRLEEGWHGVAPFLLRGTLRRTIEVSRAYWLERLKARAERAASSA